MIHRQTPDQALPSKHLREKNASHKLRQCQRRVLKGISSLQGFLVLSIVISVNFIIVSTLLVFKERHVFAATSRRERWLVEKNYSDGRKILIHEPSPIEEDSDNDNSVQLTNDTIAISNASVVDEFEKGIKSTFGDATLSLEEVEEDLISFDKLMTKVKEKRQRQSSSSISSSSFVPYYLKGKFKYKSKKFHRKRTFKRIQEEEVKVVKSPQKVWVLPDPVKIPTRNHEAVLLEYELGGDFEEQPVNKQILVNILGRYSRGVQWMDLETGEQRSVETSGADPDDRPLNDLNHVASVVVDALQPDLDGRTRKEVWLPCGFHNDPVGSELSSNFVRIVDLETMKVRVGPKLPYSGGACGAVPIEAVPGDPALVCAFGGTNGNHDTGIFLPYVSCYDRVIEKWVYPFGKLPMGMDHLSVVVVPTAACRPQDPSRVLVFNFRTKNYSTHTSAQILAFDIPDNGWTRDELEAIKADEEGKWYTFANHTFNGGEDEAYAPRDASGVVMANGGRSVVNFGGINQVRNQRWVKGDKSMGPKVYSTWYSTVRELNVCYKTWEKVADLGIETFALMAAASTKLNVAFFCGGSMQRQDFHGNTQLCLAIRISGIEFWNHRRAAVESFPKGFRAGGKVDDDSLATTTASNSETRTAKS